MPVYFADHYHFHSQVSPVRSTTCRAFTSTCPYRKLLLVHCAFDQIASLLFTTISSKSLSCRASTNRRISGVAFQGFLKRTRPTILSFSYKVFKYYALAKLRKSPRGILHFRIQPARLPTKGKQKTLDKHSFDIYVSILVRLYTLLPISEIFLFLDKSLLLFLSINIRN
jgi:hypothetical protein